MAPTPDWSTFAGVAGVLTVLLLMLARASEGVVVETGGDDGEDQGAAIGPGVRSNEGPNPDPDPNPDSDADVDRRPTPPVGDGTDPAPGLGGGDDPAPDGWAGGVGGVGGDADADPIPEVDDRGRPMPRGLEQLRDGTRPSTAALLANVAASQGAFAAVLVAAAWWTGVPAAAVGLGPGAAGPAALVAGVALGVGLYVANEVGSLVGERFGVAGGEELRAALAPDTAAGWVVLLGVVLPVVAGFEELLFRGVLIGAFAAGFPVPPVALAAVSSVAFALGHGAQGRAGIVVTGVLGAALAAGYLLTGSLVTVIVAHYLVNALEFVVHEGLGVEWGSS